MKRPAIFYREYAEVFMRFDEEKARWNAEHPGATPLEEAEAMRLIAKSLGI